MICKQAFNLHLKADVREREQNCPQEIICFEKDHIIFLRDRFNKSTERRRNADCFGTGRQLDTHLLFVH